jgi:hypothetical protein
MSAWEEITKAAEAAKLSMLSDRFAWRLEVLEEVFCRRKINAALLNGLGTGFISEPVAHHALHLVLREGLLL